MAGPAERPRADSGVATSTTVPETGISATGTQVASGLITPKVPVEVTVASHDIVIIGAGAAGVAAASSLLARDSNLDIAIIDPANVHYYQPGWTMVGAGVFKPEVTALDFDNAVTLDGVQIPAISSRSAETEVVLRDGESFAIAGLIDNRVTQVLNKVKGLGDIPVLGTLFRSHSTQKTASELLVVVTPHFIKPVPAGQQVPLPDTVVPYLPSVAGQKAAGDKKKSKTDDPKAEYVGPRGHELPN